MALALAVASCIENINKTADCAVCINRSNPLVTLYLFSYLLKIQIVCCEHFKKQKQQNWNIAILRHREIHTASCPNLRALYLECSDSET